MGSSVSGSTTGASRMANADGGGGDHGNHQNLDDTIAALAEASPLGRAGLAQDVAALWSPAMSGVYQRPNPDRRCWCHHWFYAGRAFFAEYQMMIKTYFGVSVWIDRLLRQTEYKQPLAVRWLIDVGKDHGCECAKNTDTGRNGHVPSISCRVGNRAVSRVQSRGPE